MAIHVSYSIEDVDTRKRETNALVSLNKIHTLKKALIITYDEEDIIDTENLRIEVIPVWKWLTTF